MSKFIKAQSINYNYQKIPDYPYNGKLTVSPLLTSNRYDLSIEDRRTLGILNTSFSWNFIEFGNVPYVEKLISEVEEVMDGKREVVGWSVMEGMYEVLVKRDVTICFDDSIGSDFQGELPTSEIYALLKDWLEFLKEYYKRSFVPLEWIKEEYLEEAKKLQKPING